MKKLLKWSKDFISAKLRTTFSPTVPPFAARISLVDAEVEALGDEIENV
jgi:hypothetical protein